MKYDFILVVLVYRNTEDLKTFFKSFKLQNSKVIVVNSYYNDATKTEFEKTANRNGADFLNVENKGYGYGNNRGCEYALEHYDYKYLIISNADIEIVKLSLDDLNDDNSIIAPDIITLTGKHQNPFMPYSNKRMDKIKYFAYKHDVKWLVLFCCVLTKMQRIYYYTCKKLGRIYAAHGSFVIIPNSAMVKMFPIYNERMFLFTEEEHLAKLAIKCNIRIMYKPNIKIRHKEDGSTSFLSGTYHYSKESYLEFFEYWINNNKGNIERSSL